MKYLEKYNWFKEKQKSKNELSDELHNFNWNNLIYTIKTNDENNILKMNSEIRLNNAKSKLPNLYKKASELFKMNKTGTTSKECKPKGYDNNKMYIPSTFSFILNDDLTIKSDDEIIGYLSGKYNLGI